MNIFCRILTYLMIVPIAGGLAARWIDPQKWWIFGPLGDVYNLVSFAALLMAIALLLMRSSRIIAALLVVVLAVSHFPLRLAKTAPLATTNDIKVLTFNLPRGNESPEVIVRAENLFVDQNADILSMQETQLAARDHARYHARASQSEPSAAEGRIFQRNCQTAGPVRGMVRSASARSGQRTAVRSSGNHRCGSPTRYRIDVRNKCI